MKTAILVLSHFYGKHGFSDRQLKRMNCGVEKFFSKKADYIIGTGGFGFFNSSEMSLGERSANYFVTKGIIRERVLFEGESTDTRENLVKSRQLIEKYKIDNVILVTSVDHMLRARFLAKIILPKSVKLEFKVSDYYSTWKVTIWDFFWHLGGWGKLIFRQIMYREKND